MNSEGSEEATECIISSGSIDLLIALLTLNRQSHDALPNSIAIHAGTLFCHLTQRLSYLTLHSYLFITVLVLGLGQLLHALSEGALTADQLQEQHTQWMNVLLNILLSLFSAPEPHPLLCALIAGGAISLF